MADIPLLTIHTDGAARGNPGPAAYAYVIEQEGQPLVEEAGTIGEATNNQAEYTAMVRALEHALAMGGHHRAVVHSDSELMVKQLNGEYRVKNEDLRPLFEEATRLRRRFNGGVSFVHVRREQNRRADELCNEALDGKRLASPRRVPPPEVPTPVVPATPTPAPKKPKPDLHAKAVAVLREAGAKDPEAVWRELLGLVRRQLERQLTPDD
jgi:ribonuclease HI